jgi:hypothetical protein
VRSSIVVPNILAIFNIPAKGFSTNSESSSLGGEEFGIAESSRRLFPCFGLEDLTGIRERTRFRKSQQDKMSKWSFGESYEVKNRRDIPFPRSYEQCLRRSIFHIPSHSILFCKSRYLVEVRENKRATLYRDARIARRIWKRQYSD